MQTPGFGFRASLLGTSEQKALRYLLAAWVVATMAACAAVDAATLVLLLAFGGLSILVFAQRTMSRKRHFRPYVATTPQGLVVSRSGRPGQFTVLSWSTVAERLRGGPRPWRWGADLSRDLDVHLEVARSREVFAEVNRRRYHRIARWL